MFSAVYQGSLCALHAVIGNVQYFIRLTMEEM